MYSSHPSNVSGRIANSAARVPSLPADQIPQQHQRASRQQYPEHPGTRDRRTRSLEPRRQEVRVPGRLVQERLMREPDRVLLHQAMPGSDAAGHIG